METRHIPFIVQLFTVGVEITTNEGASARAVLAVR
jgi:hypothetical protein